MVHNGIIENYRILKDALTAHRYTFRSTTDSEVFVNLIEYIWISNNCTLLKAVQQAIKQGVGAYAIGAEQNKIPPGLPNYAGVLGNFVFYCVTKTRQLPSFSLRSTYFLEISWSSSF